MNAYWRNERMSVLNFKMPITNEIDTAFAVDDSNGALNSKVHTIIIGRHGKPALSRKVWLTSDGYREWWKKYDEGGLASGQKVPRKLLNIVARAKTLISSPLPRAHETALAVAGEREIAIDEIFVEAPLPPPPLPKFVLLRPKLWGFVARCTWFIGLNYGMESHEEAKSRAHLAAKRLVELAQINGSVALFAHGWFNRMMRPYLLDMGYKCVEDNGDWHWSYRVYQKTID